MSNLINKTAEDASNMAIQKAINDPDAVRQMAENAGLPSAEDFQQEQQARAAMEQQQDQQINALQGALTAEAQSRAAADGNLASAISSEAASRQQADQSNANAASGALSAANAAQTTANAAVSAAQAAQTSADNHPTATTTIKGEVQFAASGNTTPGRAVAADDPRLSDARTPTTHGHVIGDVSGLQTALNGKAASTHQHAISDVTNLQTALDGKSSTGHGHVITDVSGLQAALNGKSNTGHGHAISDISGLQTALDGKAALTHGHVIGDVTGLQAALNAGSKTASGGATIPAILLGASVAVVVPISGNLTSTDYRIERTVLPGNIAIGGLVFDSYSAQTTTSITVNFKSVGLAVLAGASVFLSVHQNS